MEAYEDIIRISFESLYNAHLKARMGKMYKNEVIRYEINLASNLTSLHNELAKLHYKMKPYYQRTKVKRYLCDKQC